MKQIQDIPDFQKNYKIWQEILDGDLENIEDLTYITPHVAQTLLWDESFLHIGLNSISPELSTLLAQAMIEI